MNQRLVRISRFLSYLLRHNPEAEGLSLDEHGWVAIEALLATGGAKKRGLTSAVLQQIVAQNDKQRFEIDESGTRIRARQGHSLPVQLDFREVIPPEYLYHGTALQRVVSIRETGLLKGGRHHVHLSPDPDTARKVGARHGRPVVLIIRAKEMHACGYRFFLSANGVWLTERVPPEYLDFPDPGL